MSLENRVFRSNDFDTKSIESEREKNINNLPEELRIVYSYLRQALEQECDVTKTQYINTDWVRAMLQVEKGDYEPLRKAIPSLIDYSMGL